MAPHSCLSSRLQRRGAVLLEFALIALVFYLLLAALLTFGFLLYAAQGAQQVVDVAGRALAQAALPAEATLLDALYANAQADADYADVRSRVFDEHYLVLNLDSLHGEPTLAELTSKLPAVNQQLVPLMIFDEIEGGAGVVRVLRFPGAVFEDGDGSDDPTDPPPSGWLVRVPLVESRAADGTEASIRWARVLESAIDSDPAVPSSDPFHVGSAQRGLVAVRLNLPFQSAAMSGFRAGDPIPADDSGIAATNPSAEPGGRVASVREFGPYAGEFGLGQLAALRSEPLTDGRHVRPFRRVLQVQATYRREVFAP